MTQDNYNFLFTLNVQGLNGILDKSNLNQNTFNVNRKTSFPFYLGESNNKKISAAMSYANCLGSLIVIFNETKLSENSQLRLYSKSHNIFETRALSAIEGVSIFVNKSIKISKKIEICKGRCLALQFRYLDKDIILIGVYGHNEHRKRSDLWDKIRETFPDTNNKSFILAGDFNQVDDPQVDRDPPSDPLPVFLTNSTNQLFLHLKLIDLGMNGTHTHFSTRKTTSRIDRICVSDDLYSHFSQTKTRGKTLLSDHLPTYITLLKKEERKCRFFTSHEMIERGYKEINNILLDVSNNDKLLAHTRLPIALKKCEGLYKSIKKEICNESLKKRLERFESIDATTVWLKNFFDSQDIPFHEIEKDILNNLAEESKAKMWETIAKKDNSRGLPNSYTTAVINPKENDNLKSLYVKIGNNVIESQDSKLIGDEYDNFGENLYRKRVIDFEKATLLLDKAKIPNLSQILEPLERLITLQEVMDSINSTADNVPGQNGFTQNFFKTHIKLIAPMIVDYANFSIANGYFEHDSVTSLIKLIPKKGSDTRYPENLRPISLLNIDYKIITRVIVNRMTNILPQLIETPQKAVNGRQIHHNLFSLAQAMQYANDKQEETYFVMIDIMKAFDSIGHDWIYLVLEKFGFGSTFLSFIKACLSNNKARVILPNGHLSKGFKVLSGVRQGDTISPLLFVIVMEPFIRAVLNEQEVKGIEIRLSQNFKLFDSSFFLKILAFADDIALMGSKNDIEKCLELFDLFSDSSGALMNEKKCSTTILHPKDPNAKIRNIPCKDSFTYLGLPFNKEGPDHLHWNTLINQMIKRLQAAQTLKLPTTSKAHLLKSYALSLLWYPASIIPISNQTIKKINKIIYWFLWSNDFAFIQGKNYNSKMSLDRMILPKELGGFNIPEIEMRISSFKCKFLIELQHCIQNNLPVSDHLKWIEYLIDQDMIKNKRDIPLFAIRNYYNPTHSKNINSWLFETHKSYKYLPKHPSSRPVSNEQVWLINKNGRFSSPKSGILTDFQRDNSYTFTVSGKKKNYDVDFLQIYKNNILPCCIFSSHNDTSQTKVFSRMIYENAKIKARFFEKKERDNLSKFRKCVNDLNQLANSDLLVSNRFEVFTDTQKLLFSNFKVNTECLHKTNQARVAITNFHTMVYNNSLPLYSENFCCKLCLQESPSSWHLLLECPEMIETERQALTCIGLKRHEIASHQRNRFEVTRSGGSKVIQSLVWTHNWVLWKTYNNFRFSEKPIFNLVENLIFMLSMEEFRTLNLIAVRCNSGDSAPNQNWNKYSVYYRFVKKRGFYYLARKH